MDMDDYLHPMTSTAYSVEYNHVPVGQFSFTHRNCLPVCQHYLHSFLEYEPISYFLISIMKLSARPETLKGMT